MNKKFLSIILSFAVVFSVVFMNFDNLSVKVNAGLDPDIDLDIYNNSQYFYIKNVRSGKYLTLQNNSTSDGTLIHYSQVGNGSDQFLLEPVNYDEDFGCNYAKSQYQYRIMTYPNLNNYDNNPPYQSAIYQQLNYVSECVCASGIHYNTGSFPWYCNKNDFYQPSTFTWSDLNTHWDIKLSWFTTGSFKYHWNNVSTTYYDYTYDEISNGSAPPFSSVGGRFVLITSMINNYETVYWAGFITGSSNYLLKNYMVYYHMSSYGEPSKLGDLCDYINSISNVYRVYVYVP